MQTSTWLGDLVDEVYKIHLTAGNTMIIPTGWIHAVATPVDSLVFGGNFLHSYNIATQLRVRQIEISTRVPKKFQFPLFQRLCWYVGEKYLRDIKAKEEFTGRVLEGLLALADYLVCEARVMERDGEPARREAKEHVPADRVKDAASVARELRWRVRLSLGMNSDDEEDSKRGAPNGAQKKRKRESSNEESFSQFRNFRPRMWDKEWRDTVDKETRATKAVKLSGDELEQLLEKEEMDEGTDAEVERKKDVVVKVRRREEGGRLVVERQKIERWTAVWTWPG